MQPVASEMALSTMPDFPAGQGDITPALQKLPREQLFSHKVACEVAGGQRNPSGHVLQSGSPQSLYVPAGHASIPSLNLVPDPFHPPGIG